MAIRAIAVCKAGISPTQREPLPGLLTQALQSRSSEVEELGFKLAELDESRWIWDWSSDPDGGFCGWVLKQTVGLGWPHLEGIAVRCGVCLRQGCVTSWWVPAKVGGEL